MYLRLTRHPIRIIFVFYCLFLFIGLDSFPLIDWDENIYGIVSKNMFLNKEFFRLTINEQLYTEKPPFIFWITSLSYYLFGIHEFSTRLQAILSGLVCFYSIYRFGKKYFSEKVATYWCLLYSSSLIPLFLSRTAYIDHWFNTFLFLSFCSLYEYHLKKEESFSIRFPWILCSSLFIGLAVLTKGPLGLFFPIASYLFMLIMIKRIQIRWLDVLLGFFIFLLTTSLYYIPNLYLYGSETLKGFYQFQGKLLSKSLEGHTGPWFYHFLICFIGFFPWTALLILMIKKSNLVLLFRDSNSHKGISYYFGFWMLSLLLIFSLVQTKLPHYSSSIYLGLSFFGARLLSLKEESNDPSQRKQFYLGTIFVGILISVLFLSLPFVFSYYSSTPNFQKQFGNYPKDALGSFAILPGIILIVGVSSALLWIKKDTYSNFLLHIWTTAQLFFVSISLFLAPCLIPMLQDKNLRLFDIVKEKKGIIAFYKYLSFYPMFYREDPILIMGNYKFKDDTIYLSSEKFDSLKKPLYLITTKNKKMELDFLFPKRTFTIIKEDTDLLLISVQ
ncbi:MAG: glycosyltransferase family 39 protein [Leptospiraceae bacterium]|nr:glycosyltransferase family 39 protein [Leptospiraceae bacterium]